MLSGNFLYGHAIEISIGLSSYANILSDFPGEALEIVRSRWSDKNNRTDFLKKNFLPYPPKKPEEINE